MNSYIIYTKSKILNKKTISNQNHMATKLNLH